MKYLATLFAVLLIIALPSFAAEVSIAVDPNATNEAIPLRTVLNNAQLNFDELYAGAGTAETLTYASTTSLDFATAPFKTVVLTGAVTFASANLVAGKTATIRITGGASSRNYTFPAGWVFVMTAPTALAANKTGLLILRSFGTADANVVAWYAVQP